MKISNLCAYPVIDHEFRHNIVKVTVDLRGDSRVLRSDWLNYPTPSVG